MNQIGKIITNLAIAGALSGFVGLFIACYAMSNPSMMVSGIFIIIPIVSTYILTSMLCFLAICWANQNKNFKFIKSNSILASVIGLTGGICCIFGILAYVSCNKYLHDRERALKKNPNSNLNDNKNL